ncbi:MAG: LysR family transcriptional regulator [Cellvibrio sp.]|uniref:LysR family transcriptional regulator n=1 Tax=Cellvibrio sp. TaxID=1965322 RepID=UPI0031A57BF6
MEFVQQVKVFVSVVDLGSFAKAADALSMTRPSVTNAINALESSIGARLLHRTTRRSSLTGEGEIFYEKAMQLLSEVAETKNLFGGSGDSPHGRLRIDIPVAVASTIIIPQLPEFQRRYPSIEVILGVSDQPTDLIADGVDCVLRIGGNSPPTMVSRLVAHIPMVFCASPEYLANYGTPKNIEDLSEHHAVTYFSGRGRRRMEWNIFEDGKERIVHMRSSMLVNDTAAYVDCAMAGMGLIQVAGVYVEDRLKSGALIEVLPDRQHVTLPLSVLYPNRQHLSPAVRAFVDWTVEIFRAKTSRWIRVS